MFVDAPSDDVVATAPARPAQQATYDGRLLGDGDYQAGAMPLVAMPAESLGAAMPPIPTWAKVLGGTALALVLWRYFYK